MQNPGASAGGFIVSEIIYFAYYNNAVLTAYRQWVEDGKKLPIDEVVAVTNRIVPGGVSGFFK